MFVVESIDIMNRICLMIICLLLALSANAQERKWHYSIGVDAAVSSLVNVNKEPLVYHQLKGYGAVIPHIQTGRKLNEKWTIAAGLGFMHHRSSFLFDYPETTLRGSRFSYLAVPVSAQYKLLNWGGNKSWKLAGSIWNKLLVHYESNLPDMLPSGGDPLYIPANPNTYVLNARLATSLEWKLKNKHAISVAGFISRDMTPYLSNRNNAFMLTLRPSRYLFGGLGLQYSF